MWALSMFSHVKIDPYSNIFLYIYIYIYIYNMRVCVRVSVVCVHDINTLYNQTSLYAGTIYHIRQQYQ